MMGSRGSSDAQAMVIHGMGGIGKTTLAKIIYNQLSTKFDYCSFLSNIRERLTEQKCRPEELQEQLISDIQGHQWPNKISHVDEGINIIKDRFKEKKVLILFDDVDCTTQLDALARECSWFKSGSILIITTRNKDVLKTWEEGRLTYELNGLDPSLSFILFCRHAFRRDECPSVEFRAIAKDIISTTGGLPLAIEVIGSMLFGKSKVYWEGVFKKLQNIPHQDVQKKLRITYDALDHGQKQIFLDISCLSIQKRIDFAFYMWDDCKFFPEEGIEKLISLSLIKMGQENEVTIHDQLRDLGRAIVYEEDNTELGNHSRLWDAEEALEVMQRNQGTAKIQALELSSIEDRNLTSEQFKDMRKLRFLRLKNANLVGDFKNLLLDLRWLQWQGWPFVSPPTNFRPTKLVVLDLSYGKITEEWEGWSQFELVKNLKVLKLEYCLSLKSTPDFSAFEKLEILILTECYSLRRIHPSIYNLNKTLLILDVSYCRRLKELPNEIGEMEELRQLLVEKTSIRTIPISKGYMTKLEKLSANQCYSFQHLPDSIGSLINLVSLSLKNCYDLRHLPDSIGSLINLGSLSLDDCKRLRHLPDSIGSLINLVSLSLKNCDDLRHLPDSIGSLINLGSLSLDDCKHLQHLPDSIGSLINLVSLSLKNCCDLRHLPDSIGSLINLGSLSLDDCKRLRHLPDSIGSLINLVSLSLKNCYDLRHLPDSIGSLINLGSLKLSHCESLVMLPESIGKLKSLTRLDIRRSRVVELPNSIGDLHNLKELDVSETSIKRIPANIAKLRTLQHFIADFSMLIEVPDEMGELYMQIQSLEYCYSLPWSPKSIHNFIRTPNLGKRIHLDLQKLKCNSIWNLELPPEIRHFVWGIILRTSPVMLNLHESHITNANPNCSFCGEVETEEHMLLLCPWVSCVWFRAFDCVVEKENFSTFWSWANERLDKIDRMRKKGQLEKFCMLCWSIWMERCSCVYEGREPDPMRCVDNFQQAWNGWLWAKERRQKLKSRGTSSWRRSNIVSTSMPI